MSLVLPEMWLLADWWRGEQTRMTDQVSQLWSTAWRLACGGAECLQHGWFGWGWFGEHSHSIIHVPTESCVQSMKVLASFGPHLYFWGYFPCDCRCHCICQSSWISSTTIPRQWGALGHSFSRALNLEAENLGAISLWLGWRCWGVHPQTSLKLNQTKPRAKQNLWRRPCLENGVGPQTSRGPSSCKWGYDCRRDLR